MVNYQGVLKQGNHLPSTIYEKEWFTSLPCNVMVYHVTPCNITKYHGMPCNSMIIFSIGVSDAITALDSITLIA